MPRIPLKPAAALAVLAAGAAGLGAATLTGGAGDLPSDGVAKVGDTVIKRSAFDNWLRAAARGQGGQVAPDPPDFDRCVYAKRKQPRTEGAAPRVNELRRQCRQEYDQLRDGVVKLLIEAEWVRQEAEARGIEISEAEVKRSFKEQKERAFTSDKAYREFLESSGMSEQDILLRVELDMLEHKLVQNATKEQSKATISDSDLREYYDENKGRFGKPERRSLSVVVTETEARAKEAKTALLNGRRFDQVARRFSIDEASKRQGGKVGNVAQGEYEAALDRAMFKAARGTLHGPVKADAGYYLFEVTGVTGASQQPFRQAKQNVRSMVRAEREQKAFGTFMTEFRREYRRKTICADGFRVDSCKNRS